MKSTITGIILSATLMGCGNKEAKEISPVEVKKNTIIASMNRLLSDNNIELPSLNDCMILIEGRDSSEKIFVGLSCEDGVVVEKFLDVVEPTTYTTLVKNIRSHNGKLTEQGACFQMIAPDENGENQIIESADCFRIEPRSIQI